MGKNRLFWYSNMVGCIVIWGFIICGAFSSHFNGTLGILWWVFILLFCVLHPLELKISLPIARRFGVPFLKTVIMTLLFGIVWWLPLKRGVLK